jgi:hypothetical protein
MGSQTLKNTDVLMMNINRFFFFSKLASDVIIVQMREQNVIKNNRDNVFAADFSVTGYMFLCL